MLKLDFCYKSSYPSLTIQTYLAVSVAECIQISVKCHCSEGLVPGITTAGSTDPAQTGIIS